ncbi:DUF3726 domain-containing protein [Tabrizicola sp.]|uniref:DUF3726 domain-containing protein n=1 Tax=Tabrizicola sp. TaxID=2005166 RepID=UPI002FDEF66B
MTELSNAEIRALAGKAARGAGHDWGTSEEAGWAAEWLSCRGLPVGEWLCAWLEDPLGPGCPVAAGLALAEGGGPPEGPLRVPGLLLPFLHRLGAAQGASLTLRLEDGTSATVTSAGVVHLAGAFGSHSARLWIETAPPVGSDPAPAKDRARLTDAQMACLNALALCCMVPPTARSRADAGAGQDDND